jgi:hypothetical protein
MAYRYDFQTLTEQTAGGNSSSRVDYVALVNSDSELLYEAESPSVMKAVGELLPLRGFKLDWVLGQPLVARILLKMSGLYFVRYNTSFKEICIGCIVPRPTANGMVVSFVSQLLDCLSPREGRQQSLSCILATHQYRGLI